MARLDRVRNAWAALKAEPLPEPAGAARVELTDDPPVDISSLVYRLRGFPQDRVLAAEASMWVMRCIQYRQQEIANTDWSIQDEDGEDLPDHPFVVAYDYLWLARQQDLFSRWLAMRLVHGDAYIHRAVREGTDIPGGLYVLNSLHVELDTSRGTTDMIYRYMSGSTAQKEYLPDEIFHDRTDNLRSDVRGKSPMDYILASVDISRFNRMTIESWLLGDRKRGGVVSPRLQAGETLDDEALEKIKSEIRKQVSGPRGGGKNLFIPYAVRFDEYGDDPPSTDLSVDTRIEICVWLGVDPAVFGAGAIKDPLGANTTMREKRAEVARNTVRNDLRHFERYINRVILPWLAPESNGKFAWDYSKLDALIEYNNDRVQQDTAAYDRGLLSRNEWRVRQGLASVEGGDTFVLPPGARYVHRDNLGELVALDQQQLGLSIPTGYALPPQAAVARLSSPTPQDDGQTENQGIPGDSADDALKSEQAVLRELRNWELIALKDPLRAVKFVERDIPQNVADQMREEMGRLDMSKKAVVNSLFDTCRQFMNSYKIFDDVLYADRTVVIREQDVDQAHEEVRHIPSLYGMLNAGVIEVQEDEIEG